MQVKAKAARKISYDEFLTALPLVAEKKASDTGHGTSDNCSLCQWL